MGFIVNIQFGGVCLFVEQADAKEPQGNKLPGLYVLMPVVQHPVHKSYIAYDEKFVGGSAGTAIVEEIHMPLDLFDVAKPPSNAGQKQGIRLVVPVSNLTGRKPVKKKLTRGNLDARVAHRVRLPLGLAVNACKPVANLRSPIPNQPGKFDFFQAAGRAFVTFEAKDQIKRIDIGPHHLEPDPQTNQVDFAFHNVLEGTVLDPELEAHSVGDPVEHVMSYFPLLEQQVRRVESADDGPKPSAPTGIPAGPCDATFALFFVDPYRCTLGGGCEENSDDC